jgi:hypothetical protein
MSTTVAITFSPAVTNPKWSKLTAKAGEELEIAATPVNVTTQTTCFEIRNQADNIVALLDVDSSCKKKWTPPATPEDQQYLFYAILRDKPTAANGYVGVLSRTKSANALKVKGTKFTDVGLDQCFVPKQEKLVAKFKIQGELPPKGRIEIWGERYPSDKPLYTEDFQPKADNKWKWDGKKNDAAATSKVGEYISPQFSPYRLRIIVGPDDDAVKDPYQNGLGKATLTDKQFEIIVQKVQIRVQSDYTDTGDEKYYLRKALAIEKTPGTLQPDGSFAAMGRLPKDTESGRIRTPLVTHWGTNQLFDQAGNQNTGDNLRVAMGYVATRTKYDIDSALHTRPEIPVEFEVRLRSRKHASAPNSPRNLLGRLEPEALGPLRLEPFAEDYPSPVERSYGDELADIYTGPPVDDNTYFKNATQKIKQANHNNPNPTGNPVNQGGQPVFAYWLARFAVPADDTTAFDLTTRDAGFSYTVGGNELTVYLNRTRLTAGTDDDLTKKYRDYKEATATAITLRGGLTKQGDVLWVVRNVTAPAVGQAVLRWNNYPPGTNTHEFYGGIRAAQPNNLFLADYSASGAPREPIIGKGATDFPYKTGKHVELSPDAPLPEAQRERVEVQAMLSGAKKGLAGILFSPSYVGGDCYRLHAVIEEEAYCRGFGCVAAKPRVEAKTGGMSVWRVCYIHQSVRLPDVGTVGLRPVTANAAGDNIFDSPADPDYSIRAHPGDAINMSLSIINRNFFTAFNEWTIRPSVPVTATTGATPVQITAPNHGLTNGETVKISGVPEHGAANGVFVVDNVAGDNFTVHSKYDFTTPSGAGDGVVGGGFFENFRSFFARMKVVSPSKMPDAVKIAEHPTLSVTGATTEAPIKVKTGNAHGLETGHQVVIKNVAGNLDANGTFKVTKVSATEVTLDDTDGIDNDPYAGGGTLRRVNVTNDPPIVITCAADHSLATNDYVYVTGVGGNTAANGLFRVTMVDARNFRLNDSDGTFSGEYTSGGTVQKCGVIDVHRGVNLKKYKTTYEGVPGLSHGKVDMKGPADIQKQFAPFDHYRVRLPPNLPAGFQKVASNAIHALRKGATSNEARKAVKKAIKDHIKKLNDNCASAAYAGGMPPNLAPYGKLVQEAVNSLAVINNWGDIENWIKNYVENPAQDASLDGGAALVDIYTAGGPSDYSDWADKKGSKISGALLAALTPPTPSSNQPKSMPVLRWPEFFQHGVWNDGNTDDIGLPSFDEESTVTVGFCSPKGWSMFEAQTHEPTVSTFTHEMGHGCHLSHFVVDGNDFNWKQHHLLSGDCLMSYEHTSGYIPQPAAAVGPTGGGAGKDTGWPDTVLPDNPGTPPPNPPYRPDSSLSIDSAVADGDPTISYIAPTVVAGACAKCVLKLRGWNEEKLPCAWKHPDLY